MINRSNLGLCLLVLAGTAFAQPESEQLPSEQAMLTAAKCGSLVIVHCAAAGLDASAVELAMVDDDSAVAQWLEVRRASQVIDLDEIVVSGARIHPPSAGAVLDQYFALRPTRAAVFVTDDVGDGKRCTRYEKGAIRYCSLPPRTLANSALVTTDFNDQVF